MVQVRNPFYLMAVVYFAVGLLAAVNQSMFNAGLAAAVPGVNWLRVHMVVLGGITQVAFGFLPEYLASKWDVRPIPRSERLRQWAWLNLGVIVLVGGMSYYHGVTAVVGATLVLLGLICFSRGIYGMWSKTTQRLQGARFFYTAPLFLATGITLAILMLAEVPAPGGYAGMKEAHIHSNAWGFLGFVAAGILLELFPRMVDSELASRRLVSWTYWLMVVGAVGLVLGPWMAWHWATLWGVPPYLLGTLLLLYNIVRTLLGARTVHLGPARMVAAYAWLALPAVIAPFVLTLGPEVLPVSRIERAALHGLISGWALQLAMGGLPWILTGQKRGSGEPLSATSEHGVPRWTMLIVYNLGVAAAWLGYFMLDTGSALAVPLAAGGYTLIVAIWLLFILKMYRLISGDEQDPTGVGVAVGSQTQ